MKTLRPISLLLAFLCVGAVSEAQAQAPFITQLRNVVANNHGVVTDVSRTQLVGDIYEYKATLRLGPGRYDTIGLHRVTREVAPWVASHSNRAALLIHGSASNFTTSFLAPTISPALGADHALAIYLAQGGIDVWGIDLRWTFVPDSETDFSFMQNWDIAFHLADVRVAASIARTTRLLTGQGASKLFFMGHSLGAVLSYAYANADAQRPAWQRDVRGLIPMEIAYVSAPGSDSAATFLGYYAGVQAQIDSGIYVDSSAGAIKAFSALAAAAPNDPSPFIPGMTNEQAVLLLVGATYAVSPSFTPWYHYLGISFDEMGIPNGQVFSDPAATLPIGFAVPAHESLPDLRDFAAVASGQVDTPHDDALSQITAPVFYVGTAGGFGDTALHTLSLLGSTDKSSLIVQLLPPGLEFLDFGHADILWGTDAEALAWSPVRSWILAH